MQEIEEAAALLRACRNRTPHAFVVSLPALATSTLGDTPIDHAMTHLLFLVVHLVRCAVDTVSVDSEAVDRESVEAGAAMSRWFCNEAERVYCPCDGSKTLAFRRIL